MWFVYEEKAINDIIVIIHIRSYFSTAMEQICQAELNTVTGKVWCIIRISVISVISEIDISVIMCIIMS